LGSAAVGDWNSGAGADFPGGILQSGVSEAWLAKFSEAFHIFLLLAEGSSWIEKGQLYV
jgi:hypothetical protein